jgi:hypothetical protein
MEKKHFIIYVISVLAICFASAFIDELFPEPVAKVTIEKRPFNQIPIGYNLGKVGKDSVLTIKGQFVRQVGDRVMVKVK